MAQVIDRLLVWCKKKRKLARFRETGVATYLEDTLIQYYCYCSSYEVIARKADENLKGSTSKRAPCFHLKMIYSLLCSIP